jgi:hypothetical protein
MSRFSRITGTGSYLPPRRLTNADLATELAACHRASTSFIRTISAASAMKCCFVIVVSFPLLEPSAAPLRRLALAAGPAVKPSGCCKRLAPLVPHRCGWHGCLALPFTLCGAVLGNRCAVWIGGSVACWRLVRPRRAHWPLACIAWSSAPPSAVALHHDMQPLWVQAVKRCLHPPGLTGCRSAPLLWDVSLRLLMGSLANMAEGRPKSFSQCQSAGSDPHVNDPQGKATESYCHTLRQNVAPKDSYDMPAAWETVPRSVTIR